MAFGMRPHASSGRASDTILSIEFHHDRDYRNSENYTADLKATSGVLTVEFQSNFIAYTCTFSSRRDVPYDKNKFGCPIRVYYKTPFKPDLELYLGEKLLYNVFANYIIWEEHERTDFYYNTTMLQAGCQHEAQTWKSMLEQHKEKHVLHKDVWGPKNYRSCFERHGSIGTMDQPYEILNRTGPMHLIWPTDHTGVYLFNVKIVDPNYSFCELTARFAVETYGVLIRDDNTVVVSLVCSFIIILLCSFGYSYFKYMKIFGEMLYYKKID
ncbi:cation channel sperm-associated auxiliary subunit epsilon-like [Heptranchias perlo]|uniref:cation channel sperm-associated auxiliary subunit epsilon-like n=1 Tax=Heptranchias perlo TaxID=212740 RepID=UPI003559F29A